MSSAAFREAFERRRPLLVEGAVDLAPAQWTAAGLRAEFGGCRAEVKVFKCERSGGGPRFTSLALETLSVTVAQFLDRASDEASARRPWYLKLAASQRQAPQLFERVAFPSWFDGAESGLGGWLTHDTYLRLGPSAYSYPAHCDGLENLFVQLSGAKRFVLFDPSEVGRMYPHPEDPSRSLVDDVDRPDLTRFPRFAEARSCEATLHPGDLLYLPALWFHEVRALGWSASVSRYYKRPAHTEYLRAIKPPAWRAYEEARGAMHY